MVTGCDHGKSAPVELLQSLHDSQAGVGRHKCVICAYQAGLMRGREHATLQNEPTETCAHGSHATANVLAELPTSQAGEGRHKCAVCAYAYGFAEGRRA